MLTLNQVFGSLYSQGCLLFDSYLYDKLALVLSKLTNISMPTFAGV